MNSKKNVSERLNKAMNIIMAIFCVSLFFTSSLLFTGCGLFSSKGKVVGRDVTEDSFKEFYYTYSTTVNPPEFQRYRFYMEDGKPMFYHEKREGNKVFLTEEDIMVYGTMELSEEEFKSFWNYMCNGTVRNREENTSTGGKGPWLYMYWDGDKDKCQQFSFNEDGMELEFEEFCISLKEKQLNESTDDSEANPEFNILSEDENSALEVEAQKEIDSDNSNDMTREVSYPERKNKVQVSNTLELLNAIADDTEIVMDEGVYNLTADMQLEGEEHFLNWQNSHDKVLLSMNLNAFQTEVYCVSGLSIVAAPNANVSIVTEPRNVNVLMFSSCSDIFMSGITMGHTPDKGSCEGGVLKFEYCENIELSGMDLYGCGTYGIVYNDVNKLKLSDSIIRDCSQGIIDGSQGKDFKFITCDMFDCEGPVMMRMNITDALFDDCYFSRNNMTKGFLPVENMENNIVFNECLFGVSETQSINTLDYAANGCIRFDKCTFEE